MNTPSNQSSTNESEGISIVLFDGVCNLCNASVRFIIKRDKKELFRFAALQSDISKALLEYSGQSVDIPDSIVLIQKGKVYTESTAALRIARNLDGPWPLIYVLIIIPRFLRDFFYRIIAKYRYKVFGRRDQCMVPDTKISDRFID